MKDNKKKRRKGPIRLRPVAKNCLFCNQKTEPNYKDFETLSNFVSDRAKILGKARTGICAKHQRRLSLAIKRARHINLLPFTPTI